MNSELSNMVDEFLYLVEVGSGSALADESELAHLLDRIALAMRLVAPQAEPLEPQQIPARDVDVLKKVARSRFPTFGGYSHAPHPTAARQPHVEAPGRAPPIDPHARVGAHRKPPPPRPFRRTGACAQACPGHVVATHWNHWGFLRGSCLKVRCSTN